MTIDPAGLGATLYVPATHAGLLAIATGERHPPLRSVVFCLEDAVHSRDLPAALANLAALLAQLGPARAAHPHGPSLFVRPRDVETLDRLGRLPGVAHLDGFVVPKATAEVFPAYVAAVPFAHHLLMPTIETREGFDPGEMRRLREQLLAIHDRILMVRIGGNDLLQTLGARRSASRTAYDGPLGVVIGSLVATFVPWGFAMSAPVFESFVDLDRLADEVARDLDYGLVSKTAIHPAQVEAIHAAYRVAEADVATATALLDAAAPSVFAAAGAMCEPATHRGWAGATLRRAAQFGICRTEPALSLVG